MKHVCFTNVKEDSMTPEEFRQALAKQGIELSDEQMQQFATYYEFLVETNKNLNLTAITDEKEVYLKHFYDSLLLALTVKDLQTEELTLCDVGAGAGFPSLPVKIVFPQLEVSIVDSLNKRIKFLQELVGKLGLKKVHFHHARAEEFGGKKSVHRQKYDVVTARAVARMSVLTELCLPLAKVGGRFIALKAQKTQDELEVATKAIKVMGGELISDTQVNLPIGDDERHIVVIAKIDDTPKKYPRKPGTPNKQPVE